MERCYLLLHLLIAVPCLTALHDHEHEMEVMEGNRNVHIICDLSMQSEIYALYWKINGLVYEMHNLPVVYQPKNRNGLKIMEVDRRMNGSVFQCFTINPHHWERDAFHSSLTTLIVNYVESSPLPTSIEDSALKQPSLSRFTLRYQELQFESEGTTLTFDFHSDNASSCEATSFIIDTFNSSTFDSTDTQGNLMALNSVYQAEQTFQVSSDSTGYLRISAQNSSNHSCIHSDYYDVSHLDGNDNGTYIIGNTTTIEISRYLQYNDYGVQLVWSKSQQNPCTCPLTELMECACNSLNSDNLILHSKTSITISNIKQDLAIYFFNSTSGCHGRCRIINLLKVYRIFKLSETPMLLVNDDKICLASSLYHDYYNFSFYKLNVTDALGLSHSTSGEYGKSICLNDTIPDVCRPLTVTVEFIGFSDHNIVANEVVRADDCNDTETCLCSCIQERGNLITHTVSTITATTATITVDCHEETPSDMALILRSSNSSIRLDMNMLCNTTKEFPSLLPGTDYIISAYFSNFDAECQLDSFETSQDFFNYIITSVIAVACIFFIIVVMLVFLAALHIYMYSKKPVRTSSGNYYVPRTL